MAQLRLFVRLYLRPLRDEPVRTLLTIFAVALGVAVVVAIELAGVAATGSFRSSVEALTGDADFEVTAVGGLPEGLLMQLALLPYPLRVRPRIEDYAVVADSGETVPLIGLDLVADAALTGAGEQRPVSLQDWNQNLVWVSSDLGRKPGEKINLIINDHMGSYTVRGLLHDRSAVGGSVILMDIALAMRQLGRRGRLDRILVKVPERPGPAQWEAILRKALPPDVSLEPQGARTQENGKMLAAFRWNLRVLSYIALVVGAFLIYNTISVSVVRRRVDIGILRALGAGRTSIWTAFLAESAFFGLAGSMLGLAMGRLMAVGAVRLIGNTVESLYVSSTPAPVSLTFADALFGTAVGVTVAVVSALSPAREASLVPPIEAMARGRREYQAQVRKTRDLLFALILGLGAAVACRLPPVNGKPLFGYLAALLLVGACALAVPALVAGIARFTSRAVRRILGVEAMLAQRSLTASLRRTSVLVGALSTAIAMMVSVGIMVGSFRRTVSIWLDNQLQADLYLRPAGPPAADRHPTLAPEIVPQLQSVPGVAAVAWFRAYSISYQGLPATLAAGDSRIGERYGRREFLSGTSRETIYRQLARGDSAIVSEPFAVKHHVGAGDVLTLPLGGRLPSFRVVGVYYDYADERGAIIMDRVTLLKYLPDPAPSNVAVYIEPGASVGEVRRAVDRVCAGRKVLVFSNKALRQEALRIFDRTFAITYALEAVAVTVAVMGIAGALLALVIDRRRELGLLRFLGASTVQIRSLILFEAGLLGLLANLAGLILGVLLSLILIFVINKQSFGWTIQFHWPMQVLIGALSVVYAATIAAGLYPAHVGTSLNPIEVIHEE
jgi:putative ABC transport system permease protein